MAYFIKMFATHQSYAKGNTNIFKIGDLSTVCLSRVGLSLLVECPHPTLVAIPKCALSKGATARGSLSPTALAIGQSSQQDSRQ